MENASHFTENLLTSDTRKLYYTFFLHFAALIFTGIALQIEVVSIQLP